MPSVESGHKSRKTSLTPVTAMGTGMQHNLGNGELVAAFKLQGQRIFHERLHLSAVMLVGLTHHEENGRRRGQAVDLDHG